MAHSRIAKTPAERAAIAEMRAAVAAYRGPVTRCPPGVPRAHETRVEYVPLKRPPAPVSNGR